MTENESIEAAEKPKRLDVAVTAEGRAIVERAITLRLATLACTDADCRELAGQALVGICREWMQTTAEGLRKARSDQA